MLLINGIRAFADIPVVEFLFSLKWNPSGYADSTYGIVSLLAGTFLVTLLSMVIAIPIGVGAALFIAEILPPSVREVVKPVIEMLASIPSVAIGFLGIVLFAPAIAEVFGLSNGINALNGAILLAIMALPTIISVSEDAINTVPRSYKEASYAMGANKWETISKVILPASRSGIVAAIMLGMGRAVGETMTVLMATGNALAFPNSIFDSVRTLTATVAIELGEVPVGTTHYFSLFALGAVLFLITLAINSLAGVIIRRLEKKL